MSINKLKLVHLCNADGVSVTSFQVISLHAWVA